MSEIILKNGESYNLIFGNNYKIIQKLSNKNKNPFFIKAVVKYFILNFVIVLSGLFL